MSFDAMQVCSVPWLFLGLVPTFESTGFSFDVRTEAHEVSLSRY